VEPETHRLDREAMLAERAAMAERVQREVDAVVAAAAEKRREYMEWRLERTRTAIEADRERMRLLAGFDAGISSGTPTERFRTVPGADGVDRPDELVKAQFALTLATAG
jgi:hypothetical protein